MAAKPATMPPINAVANINKYGLSIFKNTKDILCARTSSLLLLIQKLNRPHNKNNAKNPVRKLMPAPCGINAATINATIAILHQGKYKQDAKLNNAMRMIDTINFMFTIFYASPSVPLLLEKEAGH